MQPGAAGQLLLLPADQRTGCAQIEVHLESTNRRVDMIAEGFDVAIRVRFPPLDPTDLVMRRLDESTQCLVTSPALIRTPLSSPRQMPDYDPLAASGN